MTTNQLAVGKELALRDSDWTTEMKLNAVLPARGVRDMKRLIAMSFVGAIFAAAGLAQPNSAWREQWFKAKYGRYTPMEEARQNAERVNAAFRAETTPQTAPRVETATQANSWREQWFKTKFGRYTPMEEARQRAEQASAAFRAETTPRAAPRTQTVTPSNSWREQWFKTKFGRYSPMEEARRKAEGLR